MKRRLLPILMTLVLVCALPIWAAFVTSGDVTNPLVCTAGAAELTLQERIDRANAGATITLSSNTEIAATLQITKNLTLDLNGHVLKMTGDGSVLRVSDSATLTITDSRPQNPHTGSYAGLPAGGVITGGKGTDAGGSVHSVGGAVFLENGTTLKLDGGTLTGNSSRGSVFINGATLVMSGGTITGETVGVHNNVGTFAMNGGRITGCSYRGVYVYNGNMTMSGTAYIGGNPGAREDIYVREPVHKHTDLSVTGGTVEGNVRIEFGANLGMTQESLKPVANSVVKEGGVFEGHIQVRIDNTEGTSVDYNTVNFIDEVAKTRTLKLVLQPNAVEKPETPATVNGREFMYWTKEGASEAWDFNTEIKGPLTLYAVRTPASSSGGYYYYPTTDTKADDAKGSPKTADPGVALYAALSILSLTGLTCTAKKR
ncbi:MAG: hypothetical protein ACLUYZ_03480 [Lachnospiraceae bacterium]